MPKGQCHKYSDEQKRFLHEHCTFPRKELTQLFNEKFGTQQSQKAICGYCKRKGWLTGRDGRIVKGNKPWNTGTKGVIKPNSGSFRPGLIPANTKPLGHERICSKDGFIFIKVAELNPYTGANTRYRYKHQVVWEKHHGAIPKGHIVRFRDGDKTNCDVKNLLCVSMAVNLRMNQNKVNDMPEEYKDTGRAISELEVATFQVMRGRV